MAATYVQISREELEGWLNSLSWKWSRVQGKAGIYLIHIGKYVSVKLSSTIGTQDEAMGRGRASMSLSLVSTPYPRVVLNRRAKDRKHFKRTTNWKRTWVAGISHWEGVYKKSPEFYDTIAQIEDRRQYKADMLKRIESKPDWNSEATLSDFHQKLESNGVLMPRQTALMDRLLGQKGSPAPSTPAAPSGGDSWVLNEMMAGGHTQTFTIQGPDRVLLTTIPSKANKPVLLDFKRAALYWERFLGSTYIEDHATKRKGKPPFLKASAPAPAEVVKTPEPQRDDSLYQRARALYPVAKRKGDQWLLKFLKNVGPRLRDGLPLSPKQQAVLEKNLTQHRLAHGQRMTRRVAALHMKHKLG